MGKLLLDKIRNTLAISVWYRDLVKPACSTKAVCGKSLYNCWMPRALLSQNTPQIWDFTDFVLWLVLSSKLSLCIVSAFCCRVWPSVCVFFLPHQFENFCMHAGSWAYCLLFSCQQRQHFLSSGPVPVVLYVSVLIALINRGVGTLTEVVDTERAMTDF